MSAVREILPVAPRRAWLPVPLVRGAAGLGALLVLWQAMSMLLAANPQLQAFSDMAPAPAFRALGDALAGGSLATHLAASLGRVAAGLAFAAAVGVALGVAIGLAARLRSLTHAAFQFLRMVSPMAWMPVAIISFDTWDGAIIFIISAAAVWPILYGVSGGIQRINPEWFELAANLGANRMEVLRDLVLPAVAQDFLAGLRLALGVAWIVLVPAELLGVTSGLGYSLNDARDALEYDRLAAMVFTIGAVGFALDSILHALVRRCAWHATS